MKNLKRKFDKQVLSRYIETECKRQLFLDLGQSFPHFWFNPMRKLEKSKRIHRKNLEILGHQYEQKVYLLINHIFNEVRYKLDIQSKVSHSNLNASYFLDLYKFLIGSKEDIFLLEHEYVNPKNFFEAIFASKTKHILPLEISDQRPDILIIGNNFNVLLEDIRELLPNGSIKSLTKNELDSRYGISIFDIKNIRESKIGKKQFVEILYYMRTLSIFLDNFHLNDKYFVRVDGNGIFPHLKNEDLFNIKNINDFYEKTIKIPWKESNRIFSEIMDEIRELWNNSPQPIKNVPANIQQSCGYCYFIEDCKKSLGVDGSTSPSDWSIKLLPYNSVSIAEQLLERGFNTIGDVAENISSINLGSTPEPIYSELPLLELKAKALVANSLKKPSLGQIHAYQIPKYTTIALSFASELDPANERVYGASFYLFMSVSPNAPYGPVFDNWWRIWKEGFENSKMAEEIHEELQQILFHKIPLRYVEEFYNYVFALKKKLLIFPKGMKKKDGTPRKQTIVIYQFAAINKKETDKAEAELAKIIINKLYTILKLCGIVENYVVVDGFNAGEFYGPSTSIFYWSSKQLTTFQDMLERTLENIVDHPKDAASFDSILSLFTPSDSEVTHPYQHKKLFNLRLFAETVFGFPDIISITWHEIAKKELKTNSSPRFWIPHFNYMDFNNWHEFLLERNKTEKKEKIGKLKRQLIHKVRTINDLRIHFQQKAGEIIAKHSRVISDSQFQEVILPKDYHAIAFVWYFFSKYTGAMDEMETDYFRTIYPEYSIGKLAAAEVKSLKIKKNAKDNLYCILEITGLSSNMKISEGDRIYLLPDDERGNRSGKGMIKYQVIINHMEWIQSIEGYRIQTKKINRKYFENFIGKEKDFKWYLFPTSLDSWSRKLYSENGLLNRDRMGISWLGARLSYLWHIRSKPKLFWPKKWHFTAPSVYLFAPQILLDSFSKEEINDTKDLITKIYPPPDESQKKAINNSLKLHLSAIQGPPGTGKSQTIAALIDEYIIRCKKKGQKSVKILVTGFSYSAIKVVIDMVRKSKSIEGKPTPSSKIQSIFLRSSYQKPVEDLPGSRHVDDLERKRKTWRWNGKPRMVTPLKHLEEKLEKDFILFANAHQLYYLNERVNTDFVFDLIIVDEASQLPVDHFMASLQFIHKHDILIKEPKSGFKPNQRILNPNCIQDLELDKSISYEPLTKVIIVGDYNQLPPVQPVKPPKNLKKVLDSLFGYYVTSHSIPNQQLRINYRSNETIVNFTRTLGIYKNLKPSSGNAMRFLDGDLNKIKNNWLKEVLEPQKPVLTLIHDKKYEIGVSSLEANLVSSIAMGYFKMINPLNEAQERAFWKEKLGVVSPHNAQGRLITRQIYDQMVNSKDYKTHLNYTELMRLLKNTIYSVEKFQGSDRELIISSIGISDKDQLNAESEFIYNLNRFNVLTSRAKSKIILICSKKFLDFIPNEREVMIENAKIRNFAYNYCTREEMLHILDEKGNPIEINLRYRNQEMR